MNKILVSIFDTQTTAFAGVTALKELHRDGDITLYDSVVVAKAENGWTSVVQSDDRPPAGTLAGIVGGALIGILGGPVGVAVGASIGGLGGALYDMFDRGIGMDFVNDVATEMAPGKVAVVADIDEEWVTPIETRLGALGGITFRRMPSEIFDEALIRESDAARAELDDLKAEFARSSGAAKDKVSAAIDTQRAKLSAVATKIDTTLDERQAELKSRLETLRAQRAHAADAAKGRIDARVEGLKASHATRQAKLEQARDLAKQAATLAREAVLA